ncbi:hypothetical protein [uncultured Sphingomonas sp.]|uniref:hypothetical protein n=1 Tax=uncultured Sphingomonas sp. TaxID=158754 RepID=UPI0035CBB2AA
MRLRTVLIVAGVIMTLVGVLWIGQGLGYVDWPASSFMIDQRPWAIRGTVLAVVGLALILFGRRVRR